MPVKVNYTQHESFQTFLLTQKGVFAFNDADSSE